MTRRIDRKVRLRRFTDYAPSSPIQLKPKEEKPEPERELLTIKEAADYLRCSIQTVRALARKGELSCLRYGRARLFPRDAIKDFVEKHTRRENQD